MRGLTSLPRGLQVALVATALLHVVGVGWGLPASDAWDNDGIAPRDFLPGLAETFTPGHYFTYPPLHLALLAILTLPVTLVAVVRAPALDVQGVLAEILQPPYMTAMALTARLVSVGMSVAIVAVLAKLADLPLRPSPEDEERMHPAAIATAWFAALGLPFTYYAHVTNLDVPYLFWASLAALALGRAVAYGEPRRLRHFALFAACGVATKDQAYAVFLVSVPLTILAWVVADASARRQAREVARGVLDAVLLGAAFLLVVDGALTNLGGFRKRLAFLAGSASQDFAQYSKDASGRWLALVDTVRAFQLHYPPLLGVFVVLGFVRALVLARRRGGRAVVVALVPLLLALSFTLCFNLVARRVEERFTLPQALFTSVYAGFGVEALWSLGGLLAARATMSGATARALAWFTRIAAVASLLPALWRAMAVDASLVNEPRYWTEAFLEEHVKEGDTVEVHGLNTYLPRFPARARVTRVGPNPTSARGPLPGVTEVQAPLLDVRARNPKWIVACGCYTWRFFERPDVDFDARSGRVVPSTQRTDNADPDGTAFFRGLFAMRLGYHLVHDTADVPRSIFPLIKLHASLGCRTFTFLRDDAPLDDAPKR